jgi:hypothetical protein
MRLSAREIVGSFVQKGINLTGIERALRLPFGSLLPLLKEEGPAPPETEILLNMINSIPSLICVADENFNLRNLVVSLFEEWKKGQAEILAYCEKFTGGTGDTDRF